MLRPCPSCPCRTRKIRSRTNRVVTGRLSRRRVARVAVTAARTPRVGRTEGRRTLSVARNLGPARGASATARTPRAGSAVSRGVATPATLDLEAETEAIAALALNRGRSVRLERRLRVLQRSTRRGALGSVGRKVREGAARSARRCADLGRVLSFRTTQPVIFDTRFSCPDEISDCCECERNRSPRSRG
jgi:hypothetical protein